MTEKDKPVFHLATRRLEALCDGIFAIAMTLLVMNLITIDSSVPINETMKTSLEDLLLGRVPKFVNFAISFVVLAAFWVTHHQQFHHFKHLDKKNNLD